MKGASWIFGFLTMIVMAVIFFFGVSVKYTGTTIIVLGSAEVYSTEYSAEVLESIMEGVFFYAADKAAEKLAPDGGGFAMWRKDFPSKDALTNKLVNNIKSSVDSSDILSYRGRTLTWESSDVTIDASDESFVAKLNKRFEIESKISNPQISLHYALKSVRNVDSIYFYMVQLGLDAAQSCPDVKEASDTLLAGRASRTISKIPNTQSYNVIIVDKPKSVELKFVLDCTIPT